MSRPLQIDGNEIEIGNTTKFLGVTLLERIYRPKMQKGQRHSTAIQKSYWTKLGFQTQEHEMDIHRVVRPTLTYAAMIWINGLYKQQNLAKLKSVQRLANILIKEALPFSPGEPL